MRQHRPQYTFFVLRIQPFIETLFRMTFCLEPIYYTLLLQLSLKSALSQSIVSVPPSNVVFCACACACACRVGDEAGACNTVQVQVRTLQDSRVPHPQWDHASVHHPEVHTAGLSDKATGPLHRRCLRYCLSSLLAPWAILFDGPMC